MSKLLIFFFPFLMIPVLSMAGQDSMYLDLKLECEDDKLYLYDFNGLNFNQFQDIVLVPGELNALAISEVKFLYLGSKNTQVLPLLGQPGDTVVIEGNCSSIRASKVLSELNKEYAKIERRKKRESKEFGQYINRYRKYFRDSSKVKAVVSEMAEMDQQRLSYHQTLKESNPFLASFYASDLYLSYQNHGGKYENEIEYFSEEYFSFVDMGDDNYNRMPILYEAMNKYVNTVQKFIKEPEALKNIIGEQIVGIAKPSKAHQFVLGAIISATKKDHISVYAHYADEYLQYYGKQYQADGQRLEKEMNELKKLMVGAIAPDMSLPDQNGDTIAISDFKGQILLLDFWASWCGPCRRENPTVVKVYDKYKDQGFEVLSVSLDKTKEKWLAAIEQDGLEWKHMSDLKGWKSLATDVYKVKAIPRTYILDQEGQIIAKNLRGEALERKMEELFSEE